jgi:hypothetical protein
MRLLFTAIIIFATVQQAPAEPSSVEELESQLSQDFTPDRQGNAEPHFGFETMDANGRTMVGRVYKGSQAHTEGFREGDAILGVVGSKAKAKPEIDAYLATKKPGDAIRLRVMPVGGRESISRVVRLYDGAEVRRQIAEEIEEEKQRLADEARRREEADKAREESLRRLEEKHAQLTAEIEAATKKLKEIMAKHGPVQILAGAVARDMLNQPEIILRLKNHSKLNVDALEIHVELFDKFDRPVEGAFGASHAKTSLYQRIIGAGDQVDVKLSVPWHKAVGKAKVSIVQYLFENGKPVKVPEPEVIEVKQK